MPKFFHPFCCCIKSSGAYSKKLTEPDGRLTVQSPLNNLDSKLPHKSQNQQHRRHKKGKQRSSSRNQNTSNKVPRNKNGNESRNGYDHADKQHRKFVENNVALTQPSLLPRAFSQDFGKKCLVVDLDETLVHSSFKPVKNADFIIPVEIDNIVHQVYVLKRPHTEEFLQRIGALFECVLFTASLAKYADPVADILDRRRIFRARLFREACVYHDGNYVKDLNKLGRDLSKVIIIDNSPASYAFHPSNAVSVKTWFDDPDDRELLEILELLEELAFSDDIYSVLRRRTGLSQNQAMDDRNNNRDEYPNGQRQYGVSVSNHLDMSPITQCLPDSPPPPRPAATSSNPRKDDQQIRCIPQSATRLIVDGPMITSANSTHISSVYHSSAQSGANPNSIIHSTVRIRVVNGEDSKKERQK